MLVDGGEGEEEGAVEDFVEIGDAVEDGDEIGEACDEADDELGEDGFGDVFAGSGKGSVKTVASGLGLRTLTEEFPLQDGSLHLGSQRSRRHSTCRVETRSHCSRTPSSWSTRSIRTHS